MKWEVTAVRANNPPAKNCLSAAYREYFSYLDASPRTTQTYYRNLGQFVKWANRKQIPQPVREDVIAYRDELKTLYKPATVQAYITAVRLFFQWTEQAGIYPNIAVHVKGAKLDNAHKRDYLTADQIGKLLKTIDTDTARGERDYCIISLMVTGGLRDIEIARANISDLQKHNGSPILYLQGKGRDEKSDYIKIVPQVNQHLQRYLKTWKARPDPNGEAPLFASMSNNSKGLRLSSRSVSAIVKSRFTAAGYDSDRLTAHSLRHSAVTLALKGGVPLQEVQAFARHRDISTTMIYAHNLEREKNQSEATIANSIF